MLPTQFVRRNLQITSLLAVLGFIRSANAADVVGNPKLACLHSLLQAYEQVRSPLADESLPMTTRSQPSNVVFDDGVGNVFTIEYPNLYKINLAKYAAQSGVVMARGRTRENLELEPVPSQVWQFKTPKGAEIAIHATTLNGQVEYLARAKNQDIKTIDELLKDNEGMSRASEQLLNQELKKKAEGCDNRTALKRSIDGIQDAFSKVSMDRNDNRETAARDINDFNIDFQKKSRDKYDGKIEFLREARQKADQTTQIKVQPPVMMEQQDTSAETKIASKLIPQYKKYLDKKELTASTAADLAKYCPDQKPEPVPLTGIEQFENHVLDSMPGEAQKYVAPLKHTTDPEPAK